MGKIKLNVLGISYSQTQSGAYALVLSEEEGSRRIPIIVGGFEAQAIAIELEGLKPPRPLTHDLLKNLAGSYGIKIIEVNIHKLEDGVFYANILCDNGDRQLVLDARTSDAIALALRFKCPIYTTDEIVEKAGIVLDFEKGTISGQQEDSEEEEAPATKVRQGNYSGQTLEELQELLKEAIENEDYEKASEVRDELKKRQRS